ncbi:MAG: XTP/dITP diphosphatase [Candidatus Njordarchaeales archaeon]
MSIHKLYFITGNRHKFSEIVRIAEKMKVPIKIEMFKKPGIKLEIQAVSLEEIVKFAVDYIRSRGLDNFFIEDAGLFINALNGFPGPFSNYVFKTIGLSGILKLLENVEDRRAYFKSAIGICLNGETKIFTGIVYGKISEEPRGEHGFGFDPIFIPNGFSKTFAEMSIDEKNAISHRGISTTKMLEFVRKKIIKSGA